MVKEHTGMKKEIIDWISDFLAVVLALFIGIAPLFMF